jgi:imidazolonepropionase-like amidohydrolase
MRAGVEAAADRGTYVAVHAYPPAAIQRAIAAGARCIEHGHLMDEATAALIAQKNIWLSTQPFVADDIAPLTGQSLINKLQVVAGTDNVYSLAKSHNIKTAFGTDILFSSELTRRQGLMLTHLTRWYPNAAILKMATSVNAELLALSGPRNPYQGNLGVIEADALADLLVVDGNPLDRIDILATPDKSLMIVMKNGTIYKNTLPG